VPQETSKPKLSLRLESNIGAQPRVAVLRILRGTALVANSLCPVRERRTMRETEWRWVRRWASAKSRSTSQRVSSLPGTLNLKFAPNKRTRGNVPIDWSNFERFEGEDRL